MSKTLFIIQIICCIVLATLLVYEACIREDFDSWKRWQHASIVITYLGMMVSLYILIFFALSY